MFWIWNGLARICTKKGLTAEEESIGTLQCGRTEMLLCMQIRYAKSAWSHSLATDNNREPKKKSTQNLDCPWQWEYKGMWA